MFIHFVHQALWLVISKWPVRCDVALIVLGGYYSQVALHSRHFRDLSTSHHNNRISISPPQWEKMAHPHARHSLKVGKKKGEGWLISVTFISVVLVAGLLEGTWILGWPASLLTAGPSRFLPPQRIMFQDIIRSIALILWRRLSARPTKSSNERTCHRGSYGLFHSRAPP